MAGAAECQATVEKVFSISALWPQRTTALPRRTQCKLTSAFQDVVLQKPLLGTADGKYRNRLGLRSFLLEIPEAPVSFLQIG